LHCTLLEVEVILSDVIDTLACRLRCGTREPCLGSCLSNLRTKLRQRAFTFFADSGCFGNSHLFGSRTCSELHNCGGFLHSLRLELFRSHYHFTFFISLHITICIKLWFLYIALKGKLLPVFATKVFIFNNERRCLQLPSFSLFLGSDRSVNLS